MSFLPMNTVDRNVSKYTKEERLLIDAFKEEHKQAGDAASRRNVMINKIFPALSAYWDERGIKYDRTKAQQDLVNWSHNVWRKHKVDSVAKPQGGLLNVRKSDIIGRTKKNEVEKEIDNILGPDAQNVQKRFTVRMTAIANVISRLTPNELKDLENEVERVSKEGYPEAVRRELVEKKYQKRLDSTAKQNWMELGMLSITFTAFENTSGKLQIEIHDQIAELLDIRDPVKSFEETYKDQAYGLQLLVMEYVRSMLIRAKGTAPAAVPKENVICLNDDGYPLISPSYNKANMTKDEGEELYREYLSTHYCLATHGRSRQAPYGQMMQNLSLYVDPKYFPPNFVFKDPHNASTASIKSFFDHITEREKSGIPPEQVFRFHNVTTGRKKGETIRSCYPDEISAHGEEGHQLTKKSGKKVSKPKQGATSAINVPGFGSNEPDIPKLSLGEQTLYVMPPFPDDMLQANTSQAHEQITGGSSTIAPNEGFQDEYLKIVSDADLLPYDEESVFRHLVSVGAIPNYEDQGLPSNEYGNTMHLASSSNLGSTTASSSHSMLHDTSISNRGFQTAIHSTEPTFGMPVIGEDINNRGDILARAKGNTVMGEGINNSTESISGMPYVAEEINNSENILSKANGNAVMGEGVNIRGDISAIDNSTATLVFPNVGINPALGNLAKSPITEKIPNNVGEKTAERMNVPSMGIMTTQNDTNWDSNVRQNIPNTDGIHALSSAPSTGNDAVTLPRNATLTWRPVNFGVPTTPRKGDSGTKQVLHTILTELPLTPTRSSLQTTMTHMPSASVNASGMSQRGGETEPAQGMETEARSQVVTTNDESSTQATKDIETNTNSNPAAASNITKNNATSKNRRGTKRPLTSDDLAAKEAGMLMAEGKRIRKKKVLE